MKKPKSFKWYRMIGHPLSADVDPNLTFVYFVEALKPQLVIKYYGGKRKYEDEKGGLHCLVQFPGRFQDVMPMPATWNPWNEQGNFDAQNPAQNTITKIIPATRYQCECGEVRLSEFPYPSVWCNCGHKAFPIQATQTAQLVQASEAIETPAETKTAPNRPSQNTFYR